MASNVRRLMEVAPGTAFGTWVVIREVERGTGHNRRFLCRCEACGLEQVKFLSNLKQGKGCKCMLDYAAMSRPGREASVAARLAASQASEDGRICLTCNEWKPWAEFYEDPTTAYGRQSNCAACAAVRRTLKVFGLTQAEGNWLTELQSDLCALCGAPEPINKRLSVDHDHTCCGPHAGCKNCIRGLLCSICNRLLGHVETKPELVPRFADYLACRPFLSAAFARYTEPAGEDIALNRPEYVAGSETAARRAQNVRSRHRPPPRLPDLKIANTDLARPLALAIALG